MKIWVHKEYVDGYGIRTRTPIFFLTRTRYVPVPQFLKPFRTRSVPVPKF